MNYASAVFISERTFVSGHASAAGAPTEVPAPEKPPEIPPPAPPEVPQPDPPPPTDMPPPSADVLQC